jgi:hypothetical protein
VAGSTLECSRKQLLPCSLVLYDSAIHCLRERFRVRYGSTLEDFREHSKEHSREYSGEHFREYLGSTLGSALRSTLGSTLGSTLESSMYV